MPTASETRHANLLLLVRHYGSVQALADKLERSHSQISQLKTQVLHSTANTPRAIGDRLARWIETKCALPTGWMDTPHDDHATPSIVAMEVAAAYDLLDADAQAAISAILFRLRHKSKGDEP